MSMKNESQSGGRVYGEGVKGVTLDAPCMRDDAETACVRLTEELADAEGLVLKLIRLHGGGRSSAHSTFRGRAAAATLQRLVDSLDRGHIAKFFKPGRRDNFEQEIKVMRDLVRVYGAQVGAMTTVRPVRVGPMHDVCAAQVTTGDGREAMVVFSGRCEMEAASVQFNDKLAMRFVRDMLDSMRLLHAGNLIHGDVKFQNIVKCPGVKSTSRVFKLIDWELSTNARTSKSGFVSGKLVKNYASPLAWRMWGLPRHVDTLAFLAYYAYKHTRWVARDPQFIGDLVQAAISFERFISANEARSLGSLYDQYFRTFDLFNLGVMFFALARDNSNGITEGPRAKLLTLARCLTHYGHPEFCASADEALELLKRL
jgi:serine/threonine protein kinase